MAKYLEKEEFKQKLRKFFDNGLDAAGQFDLIEDVLSEHDKLLTEFNSVCQYDEEKDVYVPKQAEETAKYVEELEKTKNDLETAERELYNVKKKYEERFFGREISGEDDPRVKDKTNEHISLFVTTEV